LNVAGWSYRHVHTGIVVMGLFAVAGMLGDSCLEPFIPVGKGIRNILARTVAIAGRGR
jgi:hypothetical protein